MKDKRDNAWPAREVACGKILPVYLGLSSPHRLASSSEDAVKRQVAGMMMGGDRWWRPLPPCLPGRDGGWYHILSVSRSLPWIAPLFTHRVTLREGGELIAAFRRWVIYMAAVLQCAFPHARAPCLTDDKHMLFLSWSHLWPHIQFY